MPVSVSICRNHWHAQNSDAFPFPELLKRCQCIHITKSLPANRMLTWSLYPDYELNPLTLHLRSCLHPASTVQRTEHIYTRVANSLAIYGVYGVAIAAESLLPLHFT